MSRLPAETFFVIKAILPEWVESSKLKKEQLLALPVESPRPNKKGLGAVLGNYIKKGGRSYDPKFDEAIRKKQPKWFINTATESKNNLLALPANSAKLRPGNFLYRQLWSYISIWHRSYDSEFEKAIRAKQPQWFVDTAVENKKKLLALPIGSPRPNKKGLGAVLGNYIKKGGSSYDPKFDEAIRAKHPAWFVDTAVENKKKLLALPIGSPLPIFLLGRALCRYTLDGICYDLTLTKQLESSIQLGS